MHIFGSSSRGQATSEYRTGLDEARSGRSLSRVVSGSASDSKKATLERAFDEIDKEIDQGSSDKVISEYLKASLGYNGECNNPEFECAALELSRNTMPWPFRQQITRSSVDLMVKIYISAVGTERAFTADGKLNDEDFIQFIVDHLNREQASPDEMRDRIPVRYRDGIILEMDRRGQQASGPVFTNGTVRLNNIEFRLWIEPSGELGEFERLPADVLLRVVGCLSRPQDRLNLAATSRTMDNVLDRTARFDRLIGQASSARCLNDVTRLLRTVAGAISPKGLEEGTGGLPLPSWAKVLSVAVSRLWSLPYEERERACLDILNVALDLSRHHPDPVLLSSIVRAFGPCAALGKIADGVFEKLLTAAGGLSGAGRALVLSTLTEMLQKQTPEKKRAMFDELKKAAGDLLRNNPDPQAALLLRYLGGWIVMLPAEEQQTTLQELFAMVDGWPDEFRAGALAGLVLSLGSYMDPPISRFKAIIDLVNKFPSAHRAEPLVALRRQSGVMSRADYVEATDYILEAIDGLDDADLSADLLTATPVSDVLREVRAGEARFKMFKRLLEVTVRFLTVTPHEYAVLPISQLNDAIEELGGDEMAAYTMFSEQVAPLTGKMVSFKGSFSSSMIPLPWQTAKRFNRTLDMIGYFPPGSRVDPLVKAIHSMQTMTGRTEDRRAALARTIDMIESFPEPDRVSPLIELVTHLDADLRDTDFTAFDRVVRAIQDLPVIPRFRVLDALNFNPIAGHPDRIVAAVLSQRARRSDSL